MADMFAGADLAETFIKNSLMDEFRLIVNPIVLVAVIRYSKTLTNHLALN